jgi:hypothetical protein
MGKGLTEIRSPQRKPVPDMQDWILQKNLTEENSKVLRFRRIAEASILEEPGAVIPHAGICAGAAGQPAVLP